MDRATKERKLIALMIGDLGLSDMKEKDMVEINTEVHNLSGEQLDRTLATRLGLPYPVEEQSLDQAASRVEEPELLSGNAPGGFSGAPDMSHEARPEERES